MKGPQDAPDREAVPAPAQKRDERLQAFEGKSPNGNVTGGGVTFGVGAGAEVQVEELRQ
jgi:hypothetical protein